MFKSTRIRAIIICLILFAPLKNFAQQTSLAGTWQINKDKTSFGNVPERVIAVTLKIDASDEMLSVERALVLEAGQPAKTYTEQLSFNGDQSSTTTTGGNKESGSLKKSDAGNSLTLSFMLTKPDGQPFGTVTEQWVLTDGGKTLVIDRQVDQADGGKYQIRVFYDRQ